MLKACPLRVQGAFSIMELMAVIAIIVAVTAISLPSIVSVVGQSGRKSAINQLTNIFEQARVAALERGVPTYVVFANGAHPNSAFQFRGYIVVSERTDHEKPTGSEPKFIALTKWQTLPRGIALKSDDKGLLEKGTRQLFDGVISAELPYIKFSSRGTVSEPSSATPLHLFLYEGFYGGGKDNFSSPNRIYLEKVSLSRYTGRARVDASKSL